MTASSVQNILNSLVEPKHRNFELCFGAGRPGDVVARYLRKDRRVTIFKEHFQNPLDMLGAGLHELAHHLTWELDGSVYDSRRAPGKPLRRHGKEFRKHLSRLVREFNFHYRKHMQGLVVHNPRKPTQSPRFFTFESIHRYRAASRL